MRRYMMFAALLVAVSTAAVASEFRPGEDWAIAYAPSGGNGVERGMRDAALALRSVIQEAFGVSVPVSTNAGDAARAFYLGRAFAEKAGLPCDGFVGWDNAIAERGGSFYFYGNDRTGARPQYATGCVVPSALAAVRFMKDYLGVLFVMPGAVGREVPRRESFSFPDGGVDRGSVRSEYQIGRNFDYAYNLANGIYGGGALYSYGGHTYPVACPRKTYFKTHPEYFAMKADGTRVWGGSDGCQPYCISNPGFRRLLYDELLRRYDEGADIVQLAQNDGPVGCACAECRALYGTGDDWGEKTWLFHREIAERILKDRPGKLVHIISYGDTDEPPKSFRVFPPNVLIEVARYSDKDMRRWDGYVVPHGFTYYVYNWSWYPLLGFTPKRSVAGLVDQIRVFNRYGMKGIYRCGYGEMFGMEGPAYWVYNTLVGDPGADVAAALETYYRGAFGAAAPAMRRFYEDLEKPLSEVERLNSTKASDLVESTLRLAKGKDPRRRPRARLHAPAPGADGRRARGGGAHAGAFREAEEAALPRPHRVGLRAQRGRNRLRLRGILEASDLRGVPGDPRPPRRAQEDHRHELSGGEGPRRAGMARAAAIRKPSALAVQGQRPAGRADREAAPLGCREDAQMAHRAGRAHDAGGAAGGNREGGP